MPSGHSAGNIYDINGISCTVMENHGIALAICEIIYEDEQKKTI
jgi:hypothetical protein